VQQQLPRVQRLLPHLHGQIPRVKRLLPYVQW
jgi:hypothetical protein